MTVLISEQTIKAINQVVEADQGGKYRQFLEKVIPHIGDAYRGEEDGFRSHMGASQIGKECERFIWYSFRWAFKPRFSARMVRLFNRGHLEEARFIALLLSIGVQVYQQDAEGKQYRISDCGGHFGGSGDGIGIGIPDILSSTPALLEFKTHNQKSFEKLAGKNYKEFFEALLDPSKPKVQFTGDGVRKTKPEHFAQMQVYMRKMGLTVAFYFAVNKNDDEIYIETIYLDTAVADIYLERAHRLVFMKHPPAKIHDSPGWFACKYCEAKGICHLNKPLELNCRTCHFVHFEEDGTVKCGNPFSEHGKETLDKERQLQGCKDYEKMK